MSKSKLFLFMVLIAACQPQSKISLPSSKQKTDLYFDQIRQSPKDLREFFWAMPKGGDIHHHAMGSVLAEDYLAVAIENDYWICRESYQLFRTENIARNSTALRVSPIRKLIEEGPNQREAIIDQWSMRNYTANGKEHFFNTFMKFEEAMIGNDAYFLSKICEGAAKENIQYIETMVAVPSIMKNVGQLAEGKTWSPSISVKDHLEEWFQHFESQNIDHWIIYNTEVMDHWMDEVNDHGITLKLQTVGLRILPDLGEVFGHLILAFKTAQLSKHVVGVNFVAPEDHPLAIQNYQTHMAMFRFLKSKFPEVNLSLHAGELSQQDSANRSHIDQAVRIAGAQRIGHGFDILSEERPEETLALMKEKEVAVEINLETNQVILESDSSSHPLKDYLKAKIPVCISSDDPAILRSDLTHQYIMLADYLPEVTYSQIKEMVFNSIKYSFLEPDEKSVALKRLIESFKVFETSLEPNK